MVEGISAHVSEGIKCAKVTRSFICHWLQGEIGAANWTKPWVKPSV
jgi:hypothetical protein